MKNFIVLFFCVLLFACSDKPEVSIPDTVLSKEKMAEVLVDVHLMEAAINLTPYSPGQIASVGDTVPTTIDVLKKNNINKEQYDESFDFYTKNPKLLSEIYQLVLNDLSKMQAEVMNKK
ncbi:MAG: DUF4296 domain-containing protein [Bacteroidetes bacterium]|nr:DUF4296 domain-containing protein [Bacteroidota bacterium]